MVREEREIKKFVEEGKKKWSSIKTKNFRTEGRIESGKMKFAEMKMQTKHGSEVENK